MRLKEEHNGRFKKTHGLIRSRTYKTWQAMKYRCECPETSDHFANYRGRGISICERWRTFENFLADMGERPPGMTLDRINNDGNYEPDNCRWASIKQQSNNHRWNVLLEHDGKTLTLMQWHEVSGIRYTTIRQRLLRGWTVEKALTTPVETKYRQRRIKQ